MRDIVRRYGQNPVLTKAQIPYPVETVHNAAVVKHRGEYVMLFRSHLRTGRSVIGLARSPDGFHFTADPEPFLTPAQRGPFAAYEEHGVEWAPFSPLADAHLPADLDGIYFGGGYPELAAEALAANGSMLADVRRFAASGRCVYAECGGLMYLGRSITTHKNVSEETMRKVDSEIRKIIDQGLQSFYRDSTAETGTPPPVRAPT